MPSTSSSSPAKNKPGQSLLSIVLKFTSASFTPPHVTNSSLFKLLPVMENSVRKICCASACACVRGSADQRVSRAKSLDDFFRVRLWQPVHVQRELIVQIVQRPRAPRGHFQNCRAAQAPVR